MPDNFEAATTLHEISARLRALADQVDTVVGQWNEAMARLQQIAELAGERRGLGLGPATEGRRRPGRPRKERVPESADENGEPGQERPTLEPPVLSSNTANKEVAP